MHGSAMPLALGDGFGGTVSPLLVVLGAGFLALALAYALVQRRRSPHGTAPRRRADGTTAVAEPPAIEVWADDAAPKVLVVNKSSRPVHDVRAFVTLGRRRTDCIGWIRTLPPTGEKAAKVALTADGRESWIKWRMKDRNGGQAVAVEATFCDDSGQYWRRTPTGELHPLDGAEAALQLGSR